ncbi:MAG TPA: hypothetical protein VJ385_18235 [Fibrobacteria bacterium]|nr:hypothetical protein [Fibrobacteria bacterium]
MKLKLISPLAALTVCSAMAFGEAVPDNNRNAIFASPLTMFASSGMLDFPIISVAYERSLSESGYSLLIPLHAGYLEDEFEKDVGIGAGLGIRKYFGNPFKGSYITGQTDYIKSYARNHDGGYYSYDINGNSIYHPDGNSVKRDFLSITQLSFGYKWGWRQFTLDLSGGGAFYAQDAEKYTNFIGSANVGFPFSAQTFGF